MASSSSVTQKSPFSFAFSGTPSITSLKLNGKNYMDWSSAVEIWFLGQGLSDHLTSQAEEQDDASKAEWQRVDYQLVSLLWQSIDPSLLVHYRSYKSCYDIWRKAKGVYANDIQQLYDSVHSLATLQMQDHDLTSYLNKAQSTIHQVKMHLTSDDSNKVLEKLDQMYMVFVLHGLHKDFDNVKNQVLTNPNIPTVDELIDRLFRVPLTDESLKTEVDSAILFTNYDRGGRGRGRGRGGRGNRPQCSHCNRMGHTRDRCFTLHGFPAKSANMSQVQVADSTNKDESLQGNKSAFSNATSLEPQSGNSSVCFSQSLPSTSWILDSGASDHIAGNPSLFSNLSSTKSPHFITLADGSKVQAAGVGRISPLPSLNLDSVLLVPGSPFNLLSISKLTRSLNCSVTIDPDSFYIQDRSTGQMIGAGSESHGLYFLQSSSSTVCAATDSPETLHNRLGHPSLNKFSHLQSLQ